MKDAELRLNTLSTSEKAALRRPPVPPPPVPPKTPDIERLPAPTPSPEEPLPLI